MSDVEIDTSILGIINAVRLVAVFNRPMAELAKAFEENSAIPSLIQGEMENEIGLGSAVFESIAKRTPKLADAIHDFVYNISHPHASVITKNIAREEVAKAILD